MHCAVQRAGGGLEDAVASCGQKRFFSPTFETSGEDPGEEDTGDDCTQHVEKKRRLSFDQSLMLVAPHSIESNFCKALLTSLFFVFSRPWIQLIIDSCNYQ